MAFLSLLRVRRGKVASTIYGTTCTTERKSGKHRWQILWYTMCSGARNLFQKRRGTSIKTLFVRVLVESANRWRLIGTPDIWTMKFDSCGWINRRPSVRQRSQTLKILHFIILRCFFVLLQKCSMCETIDKLLCLCPVVNVNNEYSYSSIIRMCVQKMQKRSIAWSTSNLIRWFGSNCCT